MRTDLKSERGASVIEYALLVSILSLPIFTFAPELKDKVERCQLRPLEVALQGGGTNSTCGASAELPPG